MRVFLQEFRGNKFVGIFRFELDCSIFKWSTA